MWSIATRDDVHDLVSANGMAAPSMIKTSKSPLRRPECHALRARRSGQFRGGDDDDRRELDVHAAGRPLAGPRNEEAPALLDLDARERGNLAEADLHAGAAVKRNPRTPRPDEPDPFRRRQLANLYAEVVVAAASENDAFSTGDDDYLRPVCLE
jgi:hypothetical protein